MLKMLVSLMAWIRRQRSAMRFNAPVRRDFSDGGHRVLMIVKHFSSTFTIAFFGVLALSSGFAFSQDVSYTMEEYAAFQQAVEEGEGSMIQFIQENPESTLNQYVVGAYLQKMQEYQQQGDHAKVVQAGKEFLSKVDGAQPGVQQLTTWSAFQIGEFQTAAELGEKLYESNPDISGLEFILARSFQSLQEKQKFLTYAEKACAKLEPKDCLDMLPEMVAHYAGERQWNRASSYAQQMLKAVETAERSPQASEAEWNQWTAEQRAVAFTVIGRDAFESKNWRATEQNFERVLSVSQDRTRRAESFYYIGMSRWNLERIDPAMEAFAKGSVLSQTPHAEINRRHLERLYRSTHNDSLAGLDEFISRVTR